VLEKVALQQIKAHVMARLGSQAVVA